MITLQDVLTSSGKYPDRATNPECTDEVKKNAQLTADCVNALLDEAGYKGPRKVSSGFRTSSSNAAIPNAAKKSSHMTGLAIDLEDPKQEISKLIRKIQDNKGKKGILGKNTLMMEKLEKTITWVHFDRVKRSERPSMEFEP